MSRLLVFGPGYTASRIAAALAREGWSVATIRRTEIDEAARIGGEIARATHILSSVPPADEVDPILARYEAELAAAPARWIGYLSSTGVYGDTLGGWVDESAPVAGRRGGRNAADRAWDTLHRQSRVFRLPGIYGPGRSVLERVAAGAAVRIILPEQVFSRIHVEDVVSGVLASIARGPAGVYNLADELPASQNAVIAEACRLRGLALPPLLTLDEAGLSTAARAFYGENRRVANGKAKRLLGWRPRYPDYRAGLRALSAMTSPSSTSAPPSAAAKPQT